MTVSLLIVSPAFRLGGWIGVALLGCMMHVTSKKKEEQKRKKMKVGLFSKQHNNARVESELQSPLDGV